MCSFVVYEHSISYRRILPTSMIKVASFTVENLYARPKAFNETDLRIGERILKTYAQVNERIKKEVYSAADLTKIHDLLVTLDIYAVNDQGAVRKKGIQSAKWAWMRKNRGAFDKQPQAPFIPQETLQRANGAR